jgi:hypothetical protein
VRNEAAKDGLWMIGRARQVVYAKASLSLHARLGAVQKLTGTTPSEDKSEPNLIEVENH